jgi:hypothetical protein
MTTSNRVVILSASTAKLPLDTSGEDLLLDLADVFCWWDCPTVVFFEPDLDEHTAIATTAIHGYESDSPTRPMDVIKSLPLYRGEVK